MSDEENKNKRQHEHVPAKRLFDLLEQVGLTEPADIARELGISPSAVRDIKDAGRCRKVYVIAAECFVRRRGPRGEWRVVIMGTKDHEKLAVTAMAQAMNLTVTEI